jgi:hypothetical protein
LSVSGRFADPQVFGGLAIGGNEVALILDGLSAIEFLRLLSWRILKALNSCQYFITLFS